MSIKKGSSPEAVKANIKKEIASGKSPKQAVALAAVKAAGKKAKPVAKKVAAKKK